MQWALSDIQTSYKETSVHHAWWLCYWEALWRMEHFGVNRMPPMINAALGEGRLRLYFGIVLPWPFIAGLLRAASRIDIHKRLQLMCPVLCCARMPPFMRGEAGGQDFRVHSHSHEPSHKSVFKDSLEINSRTNQPPILERLCWNISDGCNGLMLCRHVLKQNPIGRYIRDFNVTSIEVSKPLQCIGSDDWRLQVYAFDA